jgi:hypothetical protein
VAISNARIEDVATDGVRFRTKTGQQVTLAPEEFLRRLLLHVLPKGFTKIRHFGLLAAGNVNGRLERARGLLTTTPPSVPPASPTPRTWQETMIALLGIDPLVCSRCQARAIVRGPLPLSAAPTPIDTS